MKNLKFLLAAFLIIGLGLFATACSSDENPPVALSVAPMALTFEAAGGEQSLTVTTASKTWSSKVSNGTTWLTTTKVGDKIVVVATANAATARTATITVEAPGATAVVVNVSQAAVPTGPSLSVSPASLSFVAAGGEQTLTITTNVAEWTFEQLPAAGWLSVTKTGATTLKVITTVNPSTTADRKATITVKAAGAPSVTVNVNQLKEGGATSKYEQIPGKYTVAGIPSFFTTPGPSSWDADITKVEDIKAALKETAGGADYGFVPIDGAKYLRVSSFSKTFPIFINVSKEDEVGLQEAPLFQNAENLYALQLAIGFEKTGTGANVTFLHFETGSFVGTWDSATEKITWPATGVFAPANNPTGTKENYKVIIVVGAFEAGAEGLSLVGGFTDFYAEIGMTRTGTLAAPEYQEAQMNSRIYNLADVPFRDITVTNPEAMYNFLNR